MRTEKTELVEISRGKNLNCAEDRGNEVRPEAETGE
jgi:hypothetical protein